MVYNSITQGSASAVGFICQLICTWQICEVVECRIEAMLVCNLCHYTYNMAPLSSHLTSSQICRAKKQTINTNQCYDITILKIIKITICWIWLASQIGISRTINGISRATETLGSEQGPITVSLTSGCWLPSILGALFAPLTGEWVRFWAQHS